MTKGFSLIEILVVVAILGALTVTSASLFFFFQGKAVLNNNAEEVINVLGLAQNKTLASEGLSQYGVYFDNSACPHKYTLFKGSDFAGRDSSYDRVYELSSRIEFYNIDFSGNSEVVFEKITGLPNNPGDASIRLISDSSKNKTIYVSQAGYMSMEPPTAPSVNPVKDYRHVHFNYSRLIDTSSEIITLNFEGIAIQNIIISNNISGGEFFWEGEIDVAGDIQRIKIHTHRLNNPDTQFCVHRDERYNNRGLTVFISGDVSGDIINYSADGSSVLFNSIYVDSIKQQ